MSAARVLERCDELARFTEEDGLITRWYGSTSLVRAADLVAGWMQDAGLVVRRDAVGNVIGRAGAGEGTFVLGSHIDTVRDAGRYDGPLGVILAIEAAERAGDLPFALEVVAFADEEGGRFPLTYLGSRGWAGLLSPADGAVTDSDGTPLAEAVEAMGGDPAMLGERSAPDDLLGYLEVHIEQGPVLQDEGLAVGIVSAIAAQSRGEAVFTGMAGHAGNTPMRLRRDALAGAAELVVKVERMARARSVTATVGRIHNEPNVGNVIAGRTRVSYDVRHQDDRARDRAVAEIEKTARAIAERRGLELDWHRRDDLPAVPMSSRLRERLAKACEQAGVRTRELGSGAGHDAVTASRLTPEVAMLFVRCRDGISHNPAESVRPEDVAVALDVVTRFLRLGDPIQMSDIGRSQTFDS
jgi:allantoate deiminase